MPLNGNAVDCTLEIANIYLLEAIFRVNRNVLAFPYIYLQTVTQLAWGSCAWFHFASVAWRCASGTERTLSLGNLSDIYLSCKLNMLCSRIKRSKSIMWECRKVKDRVILCYLNPSEYLVVCQHQASACKFALKTLNSDNNFKNHLLSMKTQYIKPKRKIMD